MQERHVRIRRIRSRQGIPAIGVEDIGRGTPVAWGAVDGVGIHAGHGAGGDAEAGEVVVGGVLADGEGDGGDIAEGFAADVVEVGEAVLVDG